MSQVAPAIAMAAAIALAIGGVALARRRDARTKGVLMLIMAGVLVANVAIWTF